MKESSCRDADNKSIWRLTSLLDQRQGSLLYTGRVEFDKDQLTLAVQHLAFDVYHFRCYARLHREGRLQALPAVIAQAVRYSLLLHFRLLIDFFYEQPKLDDCGVGHFKQLEKFADKFRGSAVASEALTHHVKVDLNKRLAHLTETRWKEKAPAMDYYDQYFEIIEGLIQQFENALPEDVGQVFTREVCEWERKHPAI